MIRVLATVVLIFSLALSVSAQTVPGDRFRLNTGPCLLLSGSGSPEGAVIGKICDMYVNTANGVWFTKWTGSATTTGWGVGHNTNATINGSLYVTSSAQIDAQLLVNQFANVVGYVGNPNYVSQTTAWRIDSLGGADFRSVYADEGHYKVFIADIEQALAGGQIIATSVAILANAFTCPSLGSVETLTVEDLPGAPAMQVFQSGDVVVVRLMSRGSGQLFYSNCIGTVSSPSTPGGTQSWVFSRFTAPNGGSTGSGGVTPAKGLAIDYGTSGSGYHEVNAIDGVYGINSPYSQIVTWTTAPTAANLVLRTRLGNLRGITGVTGEYGAILGTYGGSGSEQYLRASSTAFETHNLNISMYSGATEVIKLDRTAPSLAIGSAAPTAYGTGTGIWMGNDGGTYKFRAGVPNGAGLFWDGATLTVRGTGGSSTNLIRNSECRVGTEDWSAGYTTATAPTLAFNLATWRLNDVSSTCYLTEAGTPANATAWFLVMNDAGARFPVVAGNRYEASVYFGLHRVSTGTQFIEWFNTAGMSISITGGNACTTASPGGLYLSGYCRSGVVATAPAGAVSAQTYLVAAHDGTGANPFMFATRAFFGEATSTQTLLSEWGPAGTTEITGGLIRTQTIQAHHILTASITTTQLNFVPATSTNVVATINASAEGIQISGARIAISGSTTFSAGYDPTGKIASGGAAGDVNANVTTISGGKITTNSITADRLSVGSLSAISADLGSVTSGSISINGGAFQVTSLGVTQIDQVGILDVLQTTGDVYFAQLTGGGNRYVCIDTLEKVFASTTACPDVP